MSRTQARIRFCKNACSLSTISTNRQKFSCQFQFVWKLKFRIQIVVRSADCSLVTTSIPLCWINFLSQQLHFWCAARLAEKRKVRKEKSSLKTSIDFTPLIRALSRLDECWPCSHRSFSLSDVVYFFSALKNWIYFCRPIKVLNWKCFQLIESSTT